MKISVVIPAHNPNPARLGRALNALENQTLDDSQWSVTLVDNASTERLGGFDYKMALDVVREERLGLTWARLRGVSESDGEIVLFVDDDNVLDPDYLWHVREIATRFPNLGAFGGRNVAEWEGGHVPPAWSQDFVDYLAIRDLGQSEIVEMDRDDLGNGRSPPIPESTPVGAGMAVRRAPLANWLVAGERGRLMPDRVGATLSSGADTEIAIYCMKAGFSVGYFPQLRLTHIIPASRVQLRYLARMNYSVKRCSIDLLARHYGSPLAGLMPSTLFLRKARAYFHHRAWSGPAAFVRWRGVCGLFDGQGDLWRRDRPRARS